MRPTARPLASTPPPRNRCTSTASQPISAAKDSRPSPPFSRISGSRLDSIASSLTDNDQAVLAFLAAIRLASGQQLARRLWSAGDPTDASARVARRALRRLETERVLERLPRRVGGVRAGSASVIYGLGPASRRLLARDGQSIPRLGTPGARYVAHTLAITELVVRLHQAAQAGRLDVIELQTEPDCWRSFLAGFGARRILKPDLFARIGVGAYEDRWFIEVDLATEAAPTVQSKAERYLEHFRGGSQQRRSGVYPRVLWTVPDARRQEQVRQALGRLPEGAQRLFVVWIYDEVIGRLSAEAAA